MIICSIRTFCKKEESHKMYLRPKREALLLKYIFRVESVFLLAPPNKQKKKREIAQSVLFPNEYLVEFTTIYNQL